MAFAAFVAADSLLVSVLASREIRSRAMAPSYQPGDRVLVLMLPYGINTMAGRIPGLKDPVRGDVVLVSREPRRSVPFLLMAAERILRLFTFQRIGIGDLAGGTGEDIGRDISILRVIGVPGDSIRGQDGRFMIRPAGASEEVPEAELVLELSDTLPFPPPAGWIRGIPGPVDAESVLIGPGEYYLAGDDRMHAIDSRHLGAFPGSSIEGRVILRYWPLVRPESP